MSDDKKNIGGDVVERKGGVGSKKPERGTTGPQASGPNQAPPTSADSPPSDQPQSDDSGDGE